MSEAFDSFAAMGFPTVNESRFAAPDWKLAFGAADTSDVFTPRAWLAAPIVKERVQPVCIVLPDTWPDPEPAPVEAEPATGVFATLAAEAVKVAACPKAQRDEFLAAARKDGVKQSYNSDGVRESWGDDKVRAARTTRSRVAVTLPSGEVREFDSTNKAFEGLRLPVKKCIRFRGVLKERGEHTFMLGDAAYVFRLLPVAAAT
ncbi:hypothetical protein [Paraburkholderia sp. BL10I2N1]|uniref:hypothetical protein n=1 Tax=Paraburkholderia sp. BL10I2N1 TaxID=1938796 RepID=UPI00105C7124|nr:hypothetical protein [Paraburkholderia sp. BL10I2N1]TDN69086.1 hypothetical protein B0G77_2455 [Paraburkholderia sp. BL10I2N1]